MIAGERVIDCTHLMTRDFPHGVVVVGGKCRARKTSVPRPDGMINCVWERKYLPLKTVGMDRKGNHSKPREWK